MATEDPAGPERTVFDASDYEERARSGPCFVCSFLAGTEGYEHHLVYEDDRFVAFLDKWPTLVGRTIVAPKRHIESITDDLDEGEYVDLQRVVHRVARAIAAVVPTERIYVLSLGSSSGNAHIHWHVAPLPPGVPYERQQYRALMAEHGILTAEATGQAELAGGIRDHLTEPS